MTWSSGSLCFPISIYKPQKKIKRAQMAIWNTVVHNLWNSGYRIFTHIHVTFEHLIEQSGVWFFFKDLVSSQIGIFWPDVLTYYPLMLNLGSDHPIMAETKSPTSCIFMRFSYSLFSLHSLQQLEISNLLLTLWCTTLSNPQARQCLRLVCQLGHYLPQDLAILAFLFHLAVLAYQQYLSDQ